jgi:hypothetical protein
LRDQLVEELKAIASSDDAAIWAHRILGGKNSLTEADARQVEDAFQAKLATLEDVNGQPLSPAPSPPRVSPSGRPRRQPVGPAGTAAADGIDKSRLTHPEPRRFRDKEHIKFVAKQACLAPAWSRTMRFSSMRNTKLEGMSSFSSVTALIFQVGSQSRVTSLTATSCRRRALSRRARITAMSRPIRPASASPVQPTIRTVRVSIRSIIGAPTSISAPHGQRTLHPGLIFLPLS